jgi:hypothetical protein
VVSDFLLRHWNIAMVMGPLGCTIVVYLGSWAISMGLQPALTFEAVIKKEFEHA